MYGFSKYLINLKISNVAQHIPQHDQTSFSIKRSMVIVLKAVYFICSSVVFGNIFLVFVENKMSSRNNKSFSEPTHWQRDSFHGCDESLPSSKFKFWQSARQFMKNSENDKDLLLRICCINYIVTNFCAYDDEEKDSVVKVNMDVNSNEQDDNKNDDNNQEIEIAKRGVASTFGKYLHFDLGLLAMIENIDTRVESQYLAKIYRDSVFVDYIYQSASRHLYQNIQSLTHLCKNTQFMFDLTTLTQGNTDANDIDESEIDRIINISSIKDYLFQQLFLIDKLYLRVLFGNLFEKELKPALKAFSKLENADNSDDSYIETGISHLFEQFRIEQKICALLPITHNCTTYEEYAKYSAMIEYFDKYKYNVLKTYAILFNGICNPFVSTSEIFNSIVDRDVPYGWGLDRVISYENDSPKPLSSICCTYLLEELARTNIFGEPFPDTFDNTGNTPQERLTKQKEQLTKGLNNCINNVKRILFDDTTQLEKLFDYCIQDVDYVNSDCDKKKYRKIYHTNHKKYYPDSLFSGVCFFIVNRLTFVVFNDLMCSKYKNNNNNSKNVLFPQLIKLFKFLFNFSLYTHCYPGYQSYGPNKITQFK